MQIYRKGDNVLLFFNTINSSLIKHLLLSKTFIIFSFGMTEKGGENLWF